MELLPGRVESRGVVAALRIAPIDSSWTCNQACEAAGKLLLSRCGRLETLA